MHRVRLRGSKIKGFCVFGQPRNGASPESKGSRLRRTSIKIVFLLCGAAALPGGARAQTLKQHKEAPGSVDGVVVNAKGAPVAGALVLWQVADGEKPRILHSDA